MLPLAQPKEERRPRSGSAGSPNLVIPQKTDKVTLTYDQLLDLVPSEEDLVPYAEPVIYWNPVDPGSYLKPWPTLGMMHDQNGQIVCWNKAEEDAWRDKLAQYSGGNPDKWKGNTGDYEFACDTCHFTTKNAIAWTDHVRFWKHK